jgi:hypothetical protein
MFISPTDIRLYALCEKILNSKYLEPSLHEEFSRLLNKSTLKEYYYTEKSLSQSLKSMESPTSNLDLV